MSNRVVNYSVALLVLTGLARGFQLTTADRGQERQPLLTETRADAGQQAEKPRVYPTGVRLVEEFLRVGKAVEAVDTAARSTGSPQDGSPAPKTTAIGCFPTIETVVAMLPDPVDSHLDWAFDSDYEAIVRAYERVGYVVDRFWLPWSERFDTVVASQDEDFGRRVRDVYPGVVLFRRDTTVRFRTGLPRAQDSAAATRRAGHAKGEVKADAPPAPPAANTTECTAPGSASALPDLQVLYLVGELPTKGVHKEALSRALLDRDRLLSRAGAEAAELRIVGPSFSGSARSVALLDQRLGDILAEREGARHIFVEDPNPI